MLFFVTISLFDIFFSFPSFFKNIFIFFKNKIKGMKFRIGLLSYSTFFFNLLLFLKKYFCFFNLGVMLNLTFLYFDII